MKSGFDFELYEMVFKDCFIDYGTYLNGKLKLSMYGISPVTYEVEHFADITLEENTLKLLEDEIVVDNLFKPDFVEQLVKLGILKEKVSDCIIDFTFYPVYKIDFSKLYENCYYNKILSVA